MKTTKTTIGILEDLRQKLKGDIAKLESEDPHPDEELTDKKDQLQKITHAINQHRVQIYFKPLIEKKEIADGYQERQKGIRGKRQTWKGLTKEQIAMRNKKIIAAWQTSKLLENSFAERQAKKHNLSITQIKNIIRHSK